MIKSLKAGLLLCIVFFAQNLNAQELKGSFTQGNQQGKSVYLYRTEGNNGFLVDSTKITAENSFTFGKKNWPRGFYKLSFVTEYNNTFLILNPREKEVVVEIIKTRLNEGTNIKVSQENKLWRSFERENKKLQGNKKNLRKSEKKFKGDPTRLELIKKQQLVLENKEKELVKQCTALAPESFAVKVIQTTFSPYPNQKKYYLEDIDFADESLIATKVLSARVQEYIVKFSGHTESGYLSAIDLVLAKAKANTRVFEYCMFNMMDGFFNSGNEDMCNYIIEEYILGEGCGDIEVSDYLKSKGEMIKSLQLGSTPPDFTIKDDFGKMLQLKKVVEQNKYTLVFFWSSWCHYCENEIPKMIPLYKTYEKKGFEVVGVSLDVKDLTWKKAIQKKNMPWKNVSELAAWRSKSVINYKVTKTPTFYVLDKNMKIVAKPKSADELAVFIRKNM